MGFSERDNEVVAKIAKKCPNLIALFLDGYLVPPLYSVTTMGPSLFSKYNSL